MVRRVLMWTLAFFVLAAVAGYAAWAVSAASRLGEGWAGLGSAWPYLLAGVLTVGAAIAGFVRLAFISEDRGYDERQNTDQR